MAGVGVSAQKVVSLAKHECALGVHEVPMGSNMQKYGAAFGMNGKAWCVIFVWWLFTRAGGRCPFGKLAGVSPAAAAMSGLHKGSAGQAKPGDIRCTPGNDHMGICVAAGGGCIAGNSGDRVQHEGPGGTYYRPKYVPDICPVKFNGKTYYYNPKTKKLCTDKKGTKPVVENKVTGGSSKGGYSSGKSNSPSSSKTSSTPAWKYKEYYKTKPKDFEHVKESIKVSGTVGLTKTNRIITLTKDWNRLLKLYPSDTSIKTNVKNLEKIYDYNASILRGQYSRLCQIFSKYLTKVENPIEGKKYFVIMGDEDELRYGYITNDIKELKEYEECYNFISESWLDFFNEMCLKRDSLKYYVETKKNYQTPILSEDYRTKRYAEISNYFNSQLSELYLIMQDYIQNNIENFDLSDKLHEINQEITNTQVDIDNINNQIIYNYGDNFDLKNNLQRFKTLRDNLINQKDTLFNRQFSDTYVNWNRYLIESPSKLNFWIEFLSNDTEDFKNYNIKTIGLRSTISQDSNIRSIYNREIPNIIFYNDHNIVKNKTGYNYLYFPNINQSFSNSSQGISAKNAIDDLLYNHSYCSEEITLSIIPVYYLVPNTRIFVYNKETGINGEYIINKVSEQLNYNGLMTISAVKAVDRLY